MKAFASFLVVLALAAPLSSCAPTFDTPPDLQPLLQAYAQPTAVVTSEIMAKVADEIAKAAEEIQNSEIFEEILQVIIDVQQELDAATVKTCDGGANNGEPCSAETADTDCPDGTCVSTGDIVLGQTCEDGANKGNECVDDTGCLGVCDGGTNEGSDCAADTDCPGGGTCGGGTCGGGVVIPTPNGQINVNYICPGWDEGQFDPDWLKTCNGGANDGGACVDNDDCLPGTCVEAAPAADENGTINLTMTLDSGGIGRVVWGTADNCRYLVPTDGENFQASYDGGVALDLGEAVSPGEDIKKLLVTFLMEGDIGFDGDTYRINQSFRVRLENTAFLVILVDVGDPALSATFNYIFAVTAAQCVRDANAPPESPCTFGCSLEESRCFDKDGNTLFFW